MAEVASLSVRVSADIDDFRKKMTDMQKNLRRSFGSDTISQSKQLAKGLMGLSAGLTGVGVAAVKMAANMEQTKMAFTTLLKSGQRAQEFLEEMETFAKNTPFDLPGVLNASKQLLAFGIDSTRVKGMLTTLGDTASALGAGDEGINRLTLAMGQMNAAGKANTNDLKQLISVGVPVWEILSQAAGKSISEIQTMVSAGAISADTAIAQILEGMNARYGGMMESQEKTIMGMWANISEGVGTTMRVIGEEIIDTFDLHAKMEGAKAAVEEFSQAVKSSGLEAGIKAIVSQEVITGIYALSGAITTAAVPGLLAMAMATIKANVALLPLMAAGAAAGVAFKFLTDSGMNAVDAFTLVASILTVAYVPAIQKFIFATGTAAVAAIKNFIVSIALSTTTMGASTTATGLLTIALNALKVGFIGTFKALAVFLIPFAKIIIIGAAVAAAAMAIYKNWDKITGLFSGLANYIPDWAGTMVSQVQRATRAMLEFIGLAEKAKVVNLGMGDFRQSDRASDEEIERLRQERAAALATVPTMGDFSDDVTSGGGGGSGFSEVQRDLNDISDKLTELKDKATDLKSNFNDMQVASMFAGLEGANKVYGEIVKTQYDGYARLESQLEQYTNARIEAEEIVRRAVESGDAEKIAQARATLEEIKGMESAAVQFTEGEKLRLYEQTQKDMTSVHTAQSAIRADMDRAYREADMEGYMTAMSDKNVAFLTQIEEQKELMDAFYQWRMESEQTLLTFAIDAANTLKEGLGNAFAHAIIGGESLGKSLANIGKQIVQMFISWKVQQMAASVFSKALATKDAAAQKAMIAGLMPSATALAWNVLVYNPSAAGVATGLQTTGMMTASSALAGLDAGSKLSTKGNSITPQGLASGGIVTRPTLAWVGERAGHTEAVLPLDRLESFINMDRGGTGTIATQNIYGDINTGADVDDMMIFFNDVITSAKRGV